MANEKQQEVNEWLRKAQDDLRGAEVDLQASPQLVEDALFHSQQAVEKAMKAFLTAHDTVFRRTHDLDELASACIAIDSSLTESLDPARDLTVFAWEFRYPGTGETPPEAEAHDALAVATRAVQAITSRLTETVNELA